jgi:C4-dicarboxylate-specific signal transduction histidine kinase
VLRGKVEFDEHHKAVLMRGVCLDITHRKQEQQLLSQQRNELAHVWRVLMVGELSSSLAHEINQPLMAILSNSQAAQEFLESTTPSKEELLEILQDITEQTKRASDIVNHYRPMLKKSDAAEELLDVNRLVAEVLRLMRIDLDGKRVQVETELNQDLPSILGVRVQLQQVLINLIINASDAMAANRLEQRILHLRTKLDGANRVVISIADRGPGIPTQNLQRIFDPLYTTKSDGIGMGLFVCRNLILAHGGSLIARNNDLIGGSAFDISLPALLEGGNERATANRLSDRR